MIDFDGDGFDMVGLTKFLETGGDYGRPVPEQLHNFIETSGDHGAIHTSEVISLSHSNLYLFYIFFRMLMKAWQTSNRGKHSCA